MISCRIVLNELPDDVFDQILCIDEVEDTDRRWRLVRRTPTSTTYHFAPRPDAKSWFVRWGRQYTWHHLKESFFGRDEATLDWQKTSLASRMGIPVARYRMLATPRLLTVSLDTILVREYLDQATTVGTFLTGNVENKRAVHDTLTHLGTLLASMHSRGLQHGSITLDHVLIQYDDPSRLAVTDWHEMTQTSLDDTSAFRQDLVDMINDIGHIGLSKKHIRTILDAYAETMPWCEGQYDDILRQALPAYVTV